MSKLKLYIKKIMLLIVGGTFIISCSSNKAQIDSPSASILLGRIDSILPVNQMALRLYVMQTLQPKLQNNRLSLTLSKSDLTSKNVMPEYYEYAEESVNIFNKLADSLDLIGVQITPEPNLQLTPEEAVIAPYVTVSSDGMPTFTLSVDDAKLIGIPGSLYEQTSSYVSLMKAKINNDIEQGGKYYPEIYKKRNILSSILGVTIYPIPISSVDSVTQKKLIKAYDTFLTEVKQLNKKFL